MGTTGAGAQESAGCAPPDLPRHCIPVRPTRPPSLAVLLALGGAATAGAQTSDAPPGSRSGCFRFEFGPWVPTLDAAKAELARHGVDWRVPVPRPDGTMWDAEGDAPALLFPAWWPNGVAVRFEEAARGDTLRGDAVAFVPDGRVRAPVATVLAWRGPCRGSPPT